MDRCDLEDLEKHLVERSNLPGPRGNIELANLFADTVGRSSLETAMRICEHLVKVSADEAPVGDPREYLSFCGVLGLGAMGASHPSSRGRVLATLKRCANDSRWRSREAVAMAIQRLISRWGEEIVEELESWAVGGSWLELRAVAAGVAEPSLLQDQGVARRALSIHQGIISRIEGATERRSEEFRALRKGLGYTLSVVAAGLPDETFSYMEALAENEDPDLRWILKQNLGKNRLLRRYPETVALIRERLARHG